MKAAPRRRERPLVVHLTTTDMSLDWLLGPQLQAFQAAGFDVVGMSAPGPHLGNLAALGVRHVPVPAFTRSTNPLDDVRAFAQLWRLLRAERPDILHTLNPKPGILGRIAGRLAGVALVVNTQHGLYAQPADRRRRRWPVYTAERFAAAFGHVELVQNPEDVDTLVKVLRVPKRKVRLLGNGIDLHRFDPAGVPAEERERLRAEWAVQVDQVVCGVVGRLVREKGITELLLAADGLRVAGVAATFVVIGPAEPGKADAIPADQIERAEKAGVVFTGQRTDMPECYSAMDVFVTASWREGFPRAAMEAAAMGLPVIAADVRGNRQVVDDGTTGLLFPVRDAVALQDRITQLVQSRTRRAAMGAAGRAKAVDQFDQHHVIETTLQVYRSGRG